MQWLRSALRTTIARRPWTWWQHRGLEPNDMFLASYPKSGNTWMKFMLSQLLTGAPSDWETSERIIPSVGRHHDAPRLLAGGGRLLKTHEPWRRDYGKSIILVRDGRDVAISFYHHQVRRGTYDGSFDEFFARFLRGLVGGYGDWTTHVNTWMDRQAKAPDQVLLVRYEDMKTNPAAALQGAARFVGKEVAIEAAEAIAAANNADQMRAKELSHMERLRPRGGATSAVRQASAGEWRSVLSESQREAFLKFGESALRRLGYSVT